MTPPTMSLTKKQSNYSFEAFSETSQRSYHQKASIVQEEIIGG